MNALRAIRKLIDYKRYISEADWVIMCILKLSIHIGLMIFTTHFHWYDNGSARSQVKTYILHQQIIQKAPE